ncbi:hypothetical protein [Lacihabitans lacunae]|uniref:Uncharacterized protein n=1 Tax=Lacihabitans lacunae TaxID=1028214 RepID=A0ABV7YNT7_9BACT
MKNRTKVSHEKHLQLAIIEKEQVVIKNCGEVKFNLTAWTKFLDRKGWIPC